VEGRKKGLIATEDIPRGMCILSQNPIITIPEYDLNRKSLLASICQQVSALGENQRKAFITMYNIHDYENVAEQYLGIVRTNGLPIGDNGAGSGIFLEACHINHAHDDNAQKG